MNAIKVWWPTKMAGKTKTDAADAASMQLFEISFREIFVNNCDSSPPPLRRGDCVECGSIIGPVACGLHYYGTIKSQVF